MTLPDTINALMGLGASGFLWANVVMLYRVKVVKGVHWGSVAFFAFLGVWNMFFYSHLHQWMSVIAGVSGISANIVWLTLAVRYSRQEIPC